MANDSSKRGFGSMDADEQREISSKGGKASHQASGGGDHQSRSAGSSRGGSHEQHVKAGQQSHKNG